MTKPHPRPRSGESNPPPPRPDRYRCPICKQWKGEHFKTGVLARHGAPGGSRYDLCQGSLHPLKGLPSSRGDQGTPPRYTASYDQPPLFPEP